MKNLSLVLNLVLLIAVGCLFYLHFSGRNTSQESVPMEKVNSTIAYIISDSLMTQYDYFKVQKAALEEKHEKAKLILSAESNTLQDEIARYQKQAIGMTDMEKMKEEERLGMKQQMLMKKKDEMLAKLDDEQAEMNEQLYSKLSSFMKEFNKGRHYNFIISHQQGGSILYADSSLDITSEVIAGLNKAYEAEGK